MDILSASRVVHSTNSTDTEIREIKLCLAYHPQKKTFISLMKRVTPAKARPQARPASGTQRGRGSKQEREEDEEGGREMRTGKARRHFN